MNFSNLKMAITCTHKLTQIMVLLFTKNYYYTNLGLKINRGSTSTDLTTE
jgi:hypothetical protein